MQLSAQCPGVAFTSLGALREIPPSALPLLLASPHRHRLLKTSFHQGLQQVKQQILAVILIRPNLHKYSALLFIYIFQTQIQGSCTMAAKPPGAAGGERKSSVPSSAH